MTQIAAALPGASPDMPDSIRLALPEDAEQIARIYAPIVLDTPISFEEEPPAAPEMARRLAAVAAAGLPWLVAERAGAVTGYAYASKHRERAAYRWSVEVSVYIDAAHRRRRVGRALYTSLLAALELAGYRNAYAGITLPNDASVRLHAALGFRPVGHYPRIGYKAGAWHDVGWYWLELDTGTGAPREPRRLPELAGDPAWAGALARGERCFTDP